MKIEAKCHTCERTFLLGQIGPSSDAPGRCPFCGARFARHYNAQLVEAAELAEKAAAYFVGSLNRVQAMETGFEIDIDGLLSALSKQVREDRPEPITT